MHGALLNTAEGWNQLLWLSLAWKELQVLVVKNWTRPQGRVWTLSREDLAATDETVMASTMALTVMAMRMWLRIVGAERSGQTAISHRHGQLWIFTEMETEVSSELI